MHGKQGSGANVVMDLRTKLSASDFPEVRGVTGVFSNHHRSQRKVHEEVCYCRGHGAQPCPGPLVTMENRPLTVVLLRGEEAEIPTSARGTRLRTAPESISHLASLACPMLGQRKLPGREA